MRRPTIKEREVVQLVSDLRLARERYDVLVNSGLRKSEGAKRMLEACNELARKREVLEAEAIRERRELAGALLVMVAEHFGDDEQYQDEKDFLLADFEARLGIY